MRMIPKIKHRVSNKFIPVWWLVCVLIYLHLPRSGVAADIILKPLTLRHGIESQISLNWPLDDRNKIFESKYFLEPQELAKKAGLDLKDSLDQPGIAGFNSRNQNFFQLFYNLAFAPSCKRDYLIQRVKIIKSFYDDNGREYKRSNSYLVEVMKTKNKAVKRADEHIRSYSINNASKRSTIIEAEIGCGVIPGIVMGRKWPYRRDSLYELIQDYSPTPGLFSRVSFYFSKKYTFGAEFTDTGLKSFKWPYFIR